MKLSVVTSLYHSSKYIEEFYERISKSINKITSDYEIIFVNDGSPDNSIDKAKEIFRKDEKVKVIDLSRNFGHHKALMTGLGYAKGDYIFMIDIDLEEEPELIEEYWDEMQKGKDTDVVLGVQTLRKGGIFEKNSGSLFYNIFNFFSEIKVHKNIVTASLMSKRFLENLLKHNEREMVLLGLFALTGFKQKTIEINKTSKGSSTYNLRRKIDMAVNLLASFSNRPLVYIFYFGMFITIISLLFIVYLVINKLLFGFMIGWMSIIASIWLFGGLILFSIGVIGIYLSKVFSEVKQRPISIIKDIYER